MDPASLLPSLPHSASAVPASSAAALVAAAAPASAALGPPVSIEPSSCARTHNAHGAAARILSHLLDAAPSLCDLTVTCVGGAAFACHRAVLAASSPVFRAMFLSGMKEASSGVLPLPADVPAPVFAVVRRYLYGRPLQVPPRHALALSGFVRRYEIALPDLAPFLDRLLASALTLDNVLAIRAHAALHDAHRLTRQCDRFLAVRVANLPKAPSFLNAPFFAAELTLRAAASVASAASSSPSTSASAASTPNHAPGFASRRSDPLARRCAQHVFAAAIAWLAHDECNRVDRFLDPILATVDIPALSLPALVRASREPLVARSPAFERRLLRAFAARAERDLPQPPPRQKQQQQQQQKQLHRDLHDLHDLRSADHRHHPPAPLLTQRPHAHARHHDVANYPEILHHSSNLATTVPHPYSHSNSQSHSLPHLPPPLGASQRGVMDSSAAARISASSASLARDNAVSGIGASHQHSAYFSAPAAIALPAAQRMADLDYTRGHTQRFQSGERGGRGHFAARADGGVDMELDYDAEARIGSSSSETHVGQGSGNSSGVSGTGGARLSSRWAGGTSAGPGATRATGATRRVALGRRGPFDERPTPHPRYATPLRRASTAGGLSGAVDDDVPLLPPPVLPPPVRSHVQRSQSAHDLQADDLHDDEA